MAYCELSDIEKQIPEQILIELTDDDGTGAVDTGNVDRAIEDADDEIDSFLSLRYSLPLPSTPGLVRRMSVDLAICNLYARRPHLDIPESRKERCDNDRKLLEEIGKGKLSLGSDAPDPSNTQNSVDIASGDRIFTRDKMSGF